MKRGHKLKISINKEELQDKFDELMNMLEDAGNWILDFLKENSLYVGIFALVLIIVVIILLIKGRNSVTIVDKRDLPLFDETDNNSNQQIVYAAPRKKSKKIKYSDIDWEIKKDDNAQEELEKEFTPEIVIKEEKTRVAEPVIQEMPEPVTKAVPEVVEPTPEPVPEPIPEPIAEPIIEPRKDEPVQVEHEPVQVEQINLVKAQPSRKFGPDNRDTARSGRIFTEEELKAQIRE